MEKHVRVALPTNKLDNVLHIELISHSDRLIIGTKNKAIIIIDRMRSNLNKCYHCFLIFFDGSLYFTSHSCFKEVSISDRQTDKLETVCS